MSKAFMIGLLLLYYMYFYYDSFKSVPIPTNSSVSNPPQYTLKFLTKRKNKFQFIVNNSIAWEHVFPKNSYQCVKNKIIQKNPCSNISNGNFVVAKGETLYEYLKAQHPDDSNYISTFIEDTPYTVQRGDVFYFTCENNQIEKLNMCPSGWTFSNGKCNPINVCTDKPDDTLIPHININKYIKCSDGTSFIQDCPNGEFFEHNHCVPKTDLIHYCKFFSNIPFLLDDMTRVECINGIPTYTKCLPGFKFFDNSYCEPINCVGLQDDTKLPFPPQNIEPFTFVPGYMICRNEKVAETIECPQNWDNTLNNVDNLTFLPMVFDGKGCAIPTFCENVVSHDLDVIVPVYEFNKHVKNWNMSNLYDSSVGYVCEGGARKRKQLEPHLRISKRFKAEPACVPPTLHLPIYQNPHQFYDCNTNTVLPCPPLEFFNGTQCIPEPMDAFKFNQLSLFKFDNLNEESWIAPWDYVQTSLILKSCTDPESQYVKLYNICSHPDCVNYAFLSMIPNLNILLPQEQQSKCTYNEQERRLKKEEVNFEYSFWNQKLLLENDKVKPCIPGQKLETGNFIWDNTIFATCNMIQPFVFCPSVKTQTIIPIGEYYTCVAPDTNKYIYEAGKWYQFAINEVKRIIPINWDVATPHTIKRSRYGQNEVLPQEGIEIAEGEKLFLNVDKPVQLELRYRVSFPPNIAYHYDHNEEMHLKTASLNYGYMVRLQNFTKKPISLPQFKSVHYVESFTNDHQF